MGLRSATAIAALALAAMSACTSGGTHAARQTSDAARPRSCPHGEKCAPPRPPGAIIELSIDGHRYTGRSGQLLSGQQPIRISSGHHVAVRVGIQATANVRVSDVWLTVNGYPSGFDGGHDRPAGKFRLVLHHAGTLHGTQQLVGSWDAARLFNTGALDLTAHYAIGDFGVSTVISHLDVEPS